MLTPHAIFDCFLTYQIAPGLICVPHKCVFTLSNQFLHCIELITIIVDFHGLDFFIQAYELFVYLQRSCVEWVILHHQWTLRIHKTKAKGIHV